MAVSEYLEKLERHGKVFVTRKELLESLKIKSTTLNVTIHRLKKKGKILSLPGSCYVIIPLFYRELGAPPIEWYLQEYMNFLNAPYYVGLLTAASYHGASHQSPQVYQIVTSCKMKPLKFGRMCINFVFKNEDDLIHKTIINTLKTTYGYIAVSSPESTALDLLMYQRGVGSLNNIAAVISELASQMQKNVLQVLIIKVPATYGQRLGYILENTSLDLKITTPLLESIWKGLKDKILRYRLLQSGKKSLESDKDRKWHLIINTQLEVDTI